jgi:hypothetical protein
MMGDDCVLFEHIDDHAIRHICTITSIEDKCIHAYLRSLVRCQDPGPSLQQCRAKDTPRIIKSDRRGTKRKENVLSMKYYVHCAIFA